jgi:hypothetical protein
MASHRSVIADEAVVEDDELGCEPATGLIHSDEDVEMREDVVAMEVAVGVVAEWKQQERC